MGFMSYVSKTYICQKVERSNLGSVMMDLAGVCLFKEIPLHFMKNCVKVRSRSKKYFDSVLD